MNIVAESLNKILANQFQKHIKRSYIMLKLASFQECNGGSDKKINVMQHKNRNKDKNHIIISIDEEKSFDKIHIPS
jgi:hypothetical protein